MITEGPGTERVDSSEMLEVHAALRIAFGGAPALVESTGAGDVERAGLLASYLRNVIAFLRVHHEGEDALVYPLLVERCPASGALFDEMTDQHERVSDACGETEQSLSAWAAAADPGSAALLAELLGGLSGRLDAHLDEEEERVLPLVEEHLTVAEWRALPGHAMVNFRGDNFFLIFGLIREQMTEQRRAQMLEMMPPPAVEAWRNVGESAFEATIAGVRGTSGR